MSTADPSPHRSGTGEVAALFDRESARYDEAHEGPDGHHLAGRMAAVVDALGPGPGAALDAGMGPGRLAERLTALGWTVSGVDISERMVERARARVPAAAERFLRGSIDALPFAEGDFDAVAAIGVVEYLEDPAAAVGELVRVLRPGGRLVVTMPNLASFASRFSHGVWYPAARLAKRRLPGFSRPAPYVKPGLLSPDALADAVRRAGAEPLGLRYLGVRVVPPPFESMAPGFARRLGARLERRGGRVTRASSAQLLMVAERR